MKKDARLKTKRSTIRDVAQEAKVSIATVCRIINDIPDQYNEKTKKEFYGL